MPNGTAYLSSYVANSWGPNQAHKTWSEHTSPLCFAAAAAVELDQK